MAWTKAADPVVRAWLTAKRIVDERPVGELVPHYQEIFDACVRNMGLTEQAPVLHVTRTAQAVSETMRLPSGRPIVLYDQYQGRVNNRLNRFVYEDFPEDLVVRFCLRHMRVALWSEGLVPAAACTGLILKNWPEGRPCPEEPVATNVETRGTVTMIQEAFVIAHELAHIAIEAEKVPAQAWEAIDTAIVQIGDRDVDAALEPLLEAETREDRLAGRAAVLGPEAGTLETGGRSRPAPDALREFNRSLPSRLAAEPHLRDEAVCDLLAASAVLRLLPLPARVIAPAIRLALYNHTTLSGLRQRTIDSVVDDEGVDSESFLLSYAVRGWLLMEILSSTVKHQEGREGLHQFGRRLQVHQQRHDRRVRAVADWAPFLIFQAAQAGVLEEETFRTWPPSWVLHDVFVEMGADGRGDPS